MFLELQNIKKSYGTGDSRVNVLQGIDLAVEKGEFCVLLGPSGSGKSTLLNIIGGIDSADEGDIVISGDKMADMKEKQLTQYRRKHLGYSASATIKIKHYFIIITFLIYIAEEISCSLVYYFCA